MLTKTLLVCSTERERERDDFSDFIILLNIIINIIDPPPFQYVLIFMKKSYFLLAWALLSMTPLKYKIESLGIYSMYEKALFIVKHPTLSSCLEDFIYPITLPFLTACCNIAISMVSFIFLSIRLSFCLLEHSFPGSILKILWAFHWNYKKTPIVF